MFDEHTWGSNWSVALPWSLDTQGQFAEKAMLAWRPLGQAQWLLSQRARLRLLPEGGGLFVANPSPQRFNGWVWMPVACLRDDYRSLLDPASGKRLPLHFENCTRPWTDPRDPDEISRENTLTVFPDNVPKQRVRFWIENLAANSFLRLRLDKEPAGDEPPTGTAPVVQLDEQGWPLSARWEPLKKPLFLGEIGDLSAVKVNAFAPLRCSRICAKRAVPRRATPCGSNISKSCPPRQRAGRPSRRHPLRGSLPRTCDIRVCSGPSAGWNFGSKSLARGSRYA